MKVLEGEKKQIKALRRNVIINDYTAYKAIHFSSYSCSVLFRGMYVQYSGIKAGKLSFLLLKNSSFSLFFHPLTFMKNKKERRKSGRKNIISIIVPPSLSTMLLVEEKEKNQTRGDDAF
jgi:hypothetical protein